mgnify:FL=1
MHSQVVGVVTTIERKGKTFSVNNPLYKIYVVFSGSYKTYSTYFIWWNKKIKESNNEKV